MIWIKEKNMYHSVSSNHEIHSRISYMLGSIRMIFIFRVKSKMKNQRIGFSYLRVYGIKDTLDIDLEDLISEGHNRIFIGKVGNFCPIKPGCNGGLLVREAVDTNGNVKYDSATGASGYRWLEAEMVKELGREDDIDLRYFDRLADAAVKEISKYGDFEEFVA